MPHVTRRRLLAAGTTAALATPALRSADAAVTARLTPAHPQAATTVAAGQRMTHAALLRIPPAQHDATWLKASLQAAIELELSTIPPYLCALWSIKDRNDPARLMIRDVVSQEMLHMGLACNMLAALGGTPEIASPAAVPRYPGHLPGGVRPQLRVALQPLNRHALEAFMQIEYPETGPISIAAGTGSATIGAFYDAIAAAFRALPPGSVSANRQITSDEFKLWPIGSAADAERAITEIKHQGEGTSQSPDQGTLDPELAHYYMFAQIHRGRRLVQDKAGRWSFSGAAIAMPEVWPMAEVPPAGYPQSHDFNLAFSELLHNLQAAWGTGEQSRFEAAIGSMKKLTPLALVLMRTPRPDGRGNYGPAFHFIA